MGAWTMVSQARQLSLGRTCLITLKWDGTYSSTSRSSSPICEKMVPPHCGQAQGASWRITSRGRCSGSGWRPFAGAAGGDGRGDRIAAAVRAWLSASPSSRSPISSSSCSMSRSGFSEERPKRARRSTASCAFSFSMVRVLA